MNFGNNTFTMTKAQLDTAVTDTNLQEDIDGTAVTDVVATTSDHILIQDADNSNALRRDSIADVLALVNTDTGLASVQVFTTNGTWTRPTDITKVLMFVTGGGGNGGDRGSTYNYYASGGSGGAGGTAIKLLDVSAIASSTITVSTGGGTSSWADGTNTISGNGGSNGGDAYHERGGSRGSGGSASGGDLNITGGNGQGGGTPWAGNDTFPGTENAEPAMGAASFWGSEGAYGSGGYGTADSSTGGSGSAGVVFVLEFK
jgi:hypothetical protein